MKNFDFCVYTYKHRKALEYLVHKLIKDADTKTEMLKRIKIHDMDKMTMYQFLEKEEASKIHRNTTYHHMTNILPKSKFDYIEAILDYESAGYTKPDKPLNAYDTINRFKKDKTLSQETIKELRKVLVELDINSSYSVTDDTEGMKYLESFSNITEEDIKNELITYITK